MSDVATMVVRMVVKSIRMRILLGRPPAWSSSATIVNVVNTAGGPLGRMARSIAFAAGLSLCACERREPPGAGVDASQSTSSLAMSAAVTPSRTTPAALTSSRGMPGAVSSSVAGPAADASPRAVLPAVTSPPVKGVCDAATPNCAAPIELDAVSLPQTDARPVASGPTFDARVRALWNAIVADDPDGAMTFFFPLGAYRQVKDVTDPQSDWKHRLVAAYRHDIHALHARLGDGARRAELVRLDVPDSRARWVDPGEEWNKIGYFRVFGSRLRYTIDGSERTFDVKSLISWRGDWYVVHLSAIK
jgi:hypothetical protein